MTATSSSSATVRETTMTGRSIRWRPTTPRTSKALSADKVWSVTATSHVSPVRADRSSASVSTRDQVGSNPLRRSSVTMCSASSGRSSTIRTRNGLAMPSPDHSIRLRFA